MFIIAVKNLSKIYPVAIKKPELKGTLTHFFRRTYREIKALQNVSFQIQPGEVVGFVGANGAGKTITLKMLTGLIHPCEGEVIVADYIPFRRQPEFLHKTSLVMGQQFC